MIEIRSRFRGFKIADGRIFTGQSVHSDMDRDRIVVCASYEDARRLAQEHEKTLSESL